MRPAPARDLVGKRLCGHWLRGFVFGISNTAVTPPSTADRLPDLEIFLVLEPGLAEMHLACR